MGMHHTGTVPARGNGWGEMGGGGGKAGGNCEGAFNFKKGVTD